VSSEKKESASDLLNAEEHHQINNYLAAEIIN